MALSRPHLNFKTSPSGLIVPSTADNPGLDAVDVTHEWAGGHFGAPAATDAVGLGSGDKGYTYFNTVSLTLRVWDGTSWNNLTMTSSGALAAPTITSFTPTSGSDGASVVITGTSFTGATAVKFNGVNAASYTVNSATQITAVAPTGVTTGPIAVTTAYGTGTSSTNFTASAHPYWDAVLALTPVAYWKLNEAGGSTSFADATGNGHTATVRSGGSVTAGDASSPTGTGIVLSGATKSFLTAPDSAALDLITTMTYLAWVRSDAFPSGVGDGYQMFMSKGADSPNFGFALRLNTTGHLELLKDDSVLLATSSGAISAAAWHMVGVSGTAGGSYTFWIDGASAGTGSSGTAVQATDCVFAIGNDVTGAGGATDGGEMFKGKIAEVAVFNTVLTSTQIAALYAAA